MIAAKEKKLTKSDGATNGSKPAYVAAPIYKTKKGRLYLGRCEDVLTSQRTKRLKGKVQLIFTSPPFPLNDKKKYGNLKGDAYLQWLGEFGPIFADMLTPTGSIVMEVGNAWEPGSPVQSILPYQSLLRFLETGKLKLCQEITYYNPARLPSPAQWVTVERIRLKDATSKIWWMAKTEKPKADNRNVLAPYSAAMKSLLARGKYNSGKRPSEHNIGETSFLKDNGGAIAPNLIEVANTQSTLKYQQFCKENDLTQHPARMPDKIAEFFIKFLTDENDLVLDPFAGSNTTGSTAEKLNRRWISIEALPQYAVPSISHFDEPLAAKMMRRIANLPK